MSTYPDGLTFADYAGKKTYTCKKCNKELRYAKFFKPDGKILTKDGKEPDGLYTKDTNVFSTSILADNKELHTCYNIEWPSLQPKDVPESQLKQIDILDDSLTDMDKKVMEKMVDDAYHDAQFMLWTLQGVEKACKEAGVELGPKSGMIFNQVCENLRRRNERE